VTLTYDLEVVSESRVMWATSVPILVFLGLSVLDLGTMYATDRHQTDRRNVYVHLCTCLSVTRRCCVTVKTVKLILKL